MGFERLILAAFLAATLASHVVLAVVEPLPKDSNADGVTDDAPSLTYYAAFGESLLGARANGTA